jgi:ABC-type oligopeptide transport system substrate-binding subunit
MPPITYMISSSDIALQQAELLREMWMDELGCNVEQITIEQVQFGILLASTRPDAGAQRPDLWDLGWASYYPDQANWLGDVLHCNDSENRQLRPCSEVDRIIRQAGGDIPAEDRGELYRQAEREFFAADGLEPLSPLFVRGDYVLRQGWINYTPVHFGGEQYDTYQLNAEVKELEQNR